MATKNVPKLILGYDMGSDLSSSLKSRLSDMSPHIIFYPWKLSSANLINDLKDHLAGVVVSGSSKCVNSIKYDPPNLPEDLFELDVPMLFICYGMQYVLKRDGSPIVRCWKNVEKVIKDKNIEKDPGEVGPVKFVRSKDPIFEGLPQVFTVWMKHRWMASNLPQGWKLLGSTELCPIAAARKGNRWAVQFHPEHYYSLSGRIILYNFLQKICGIKTSFF